MIKMLYNRCTGIYKFGNNTYPGRTRCRSNLGHIFWEKKCVLWAGKYGIQFDSENISFDASLVIYINSTNIPPIMIINRIYET